MLYLIVALINAIYGIMLILSVGPDTPGITLILFIGIVLSILGLVGFGLWIWQTVSLVNNKETSAKNSLKSWWQIARGIDILLIFGLLFRFFVLQPFIVEGSSMEPNYHDKEYLLVNQMTYRLRAPKRGETIIFHYPADPQQDYIKRIIGLPGETVEIYNNHVYVNGTALNEPYIPQDFVTVFGSGPDEKFTKNLANGEYFVLGDNRSHSSDSREWGILPRGDIIGRAWLTIYPFKYGGLVHNPSLNVP